MYSLIKTTAIYHYMTRQKQKGIHHCMPTDKPQKRISIRLYSMQKVNMISSHTEYSLRQYGIKRNTPKVPFFNRLKRK